MVSKNRAERIGKRIQEVLSELLLFEVTDPRLIGVYITDAEVDQDLSNAHIFVSALEDEERKDEILEGFQHAAGFLRTRLAKQLDLRVFPKLYFHWDATPEKAERIEKLISGLNSEDSQKGASRG
ncbi:MAG: 30S ribosome-binding factor RbfA [Anaerolineales bacterium]